LKNRSLILLGLLTYALGVNAQNEDVERVKVKFPDAKTVNLLSSCHYEVEQDAEKWIITNTRIDERIYTDDKVSSVMKDNVSYNSFFDLKDIEAITYSYTGRKYKKHTVKEYAVNTNTSRNAFYDDGKEKVFYFEHITPGSKTYLKYNLELTRPQFISPFYMQSYVPSEKIELSITVPGNVTIGYKIFNLSEEEYTYTTSIKSGQTTHKWIRTDVAKMEYEGDAPPPSYYLPSIHIYIKEYTTDGVTTPMLGTADGLHTYYQSLIRGYDNEQDENSAFLLGVVDSIKSLHTTELARVEGIFNWVQSNIKYIAFEYELSGFVPRPAHLVCSRKYGDCKDMANSIKYMLELAEIDGHLTWIGTKSLPYKYSEISTPSVDNHMICTYFNKKGEAIFLDATDSYIPFGYPASHIQGKEAMVSMSQDSMQLVEVPIPGIDFSYLKDSVLLTIDGATLSGKGQYIEAGYFKNNTTYRLLNTDDSELKKYYENKLELGSNKFLLDTITVENLDDHKKPIVVNYEFRIPSMIQSYQDELYIDLNLYKSVGTKVKEDRKLPYMYRNKMGHTEKYILTIPAGYQVSYLPKSLNEKIGDFVYNIDYEQVENTIVYTFYQGRDTLFFTPDLFQDWNEAFKRMNDQFSESIVLKKI
jgi:hypothetical protein